MSYRRSFSKTISVHYSGVASKTVTFRVGDSTHTEYVSIPYSGEAQENVTVNIDVDTTPFDLSVRDCNQNVGLLTGSIVATEAAQVSSIKEKAQRVGETIVSGFFATVKSEISQQIAELTSRIDADLIHLNELAKRCRDKQRQMEVDYTRLSTRYSAIFTDLNKELENRIYELAKPVFKFSESANSSTERVLKSGMSGTIAIAGKENAHLGAMLGASNAKNQANRAIGKTNDFLTKQNMTDRILKNCTINDAYGGSYFVPVSFIETHNEKASVDRQVYTPDILADRQRGEILDKITDRRLSIDETGKKQVGQYFNAMLASDFRNADKHSERVRECMSKMFNRL